MPRPRATQPASGKSSTRLRALLLHHTRPLERALKHPGTLLRRRGRLHEFRVQTRMASAATLLASPCTEPALARKLTRLLRKLRRAAGTVRDLDVAGEIMLTRLPSGTRAREAAEKSLHDHQRKARRKARTKLDASARRAVRTLLRRIEATPASLPAPSLESAVRAALARCIERLDSAVRTCSSNPDAVHLVRRRLRMLRLVILVARPVCRSPALTRVEPRLKAWQTRLGEVNDLYRADLLLGELGKRLPRDPAGKKAVARAAARLHRDRILAAARAAKALRSPAPWSQLARWCTPPVGPGKSSPRTARTPR